MCQFSVSDHFAHWNISSSWPRLLKFTGNVNHISPKTVCMFDVDSLITSGWKWTLTLTSLYDAMLQQTMWTMPNVSATAQHSPAWLRRLCSNWNYLSDELSHAFLGQTVTETHGSQYLLFVVVEGLHVCRRIHTHQRSLLLIKYIYNNPNLFNNNINEILIWPKR